MPQKAGRGRFDSALVAGFQLTLCNGVVDFWRMENSIWKSGICI
jgi:hypothetical protein